MKILCSKKIKYRLLSEYSLYSALALLVLVTIFFAVFFGQIKTKYSIKQFQPESHDTISIQTKVEDDFLLTESSPILITLIKGHNGTWLDDASMIKIKKLQEELELIQGVEYLTNITNLPIVILDGQQFNMGSISDLSDKSEVLKNPTIVPQFLSANGKATSILLYTESLSKKARTILIAKIESLLKKRFDDNFYLSGIPIFGNEMSRVLNSEILLFTFLSIVLALLVIVLVFKNLSAPIICLLGLFILNILSLGVLNLLNLPFTVLTSSIPILIAISLISILSHYQFNLWKNSKNKSMNGKDLAIYTSQTLLKSQVLASLTTIVGFACLIPSSVPVISQFGIGVCVSVSLATFLAILFLPLIYANISCPEPREFLVRSKNNFSGSGRFKVIINIFGTLSFAIIAISIAQHYANGLNWSTKLMDDLPKANKIQIANSYIDRNMGGLLPLNVIIESRGDSANFKSADQLLNLERFVNWLRSQENIGSTLALSDFINLASRDERRIESTNKIKETLFLYGTSEENPIDYFLSPSGSNTRISLYLKDRDSADILKLVNSIKLKAQEHFREAEVITAGQALTHHLINREISERLIYGFFTALLFIFFIVLFQFRSLSWTLLAIVPNLIPAFSLLYVLLVFQIPIKPGIAIVFSISLGLAFDNTIYLLNTLKSKVLQKNRIESVDIIECFNAQRGGCLLSSLTNMAGFSIFILSQFGVSQSFGFFMVLAIVSGLFADLYLLPKILIILHKVKSYYQLKEIDSLGKDAKHA